jgi:hypothetical protein
MPGLSFNKVSLFPDIYGTTVIMKVDSSEILTNYHLSPEENGDLRVLSPVSE